MVVHAASKAPCVVLARTSSILRALGLVCVLLLDRLLDRLLGLLLSRLRRPTAEKSTDSVANGGSDGNATVTSTRSARKRQHKGRDGNVNLRRSARHLTKQARRLALLLGSLLLTRRSCSRGSRTLLRRLWRRRGACWSSSWT